MRAIAHPIRHSGARRPASARFASYGGFESADARQREGGRRDPGIQTLARSVRLDFGSPLRGGRNDKPSEWL